MVSNDAYTVMMGMGMGMMGVMDEETDARKVSTWSDSESRHFPLYHGASLDSQDWPTREALIVTAQRRFGQ